MKSGQRMSDCLGFACHGLTAVLFGLRLLQVFPDYNAVNLAMEGVYGGVCGWIAGFFGAAKGSSMRFNCWMSMGTFWFTHSLANMLPFWGWWQTDPQDYIGYYLLLWGIWFILLGSAALRTDAIFLSTYLVFGLSLVTAGIGNAAKSEGIIQFGGGLAVLGGLIAMYGTTAHLLNDSFARRLLPLVPLNFF